MEKVAAVSLGAGFVDDLNAERERVVEELFRIAGDPRGIADATTYVQAELSRHLRNRKRF